MQEYFIPIYIIIIKNKTSDINDLNSKLEESLNMSISENQT